MKKVSIVKFEKDLKEVIIKAVDLIGGFGQFIKKDAELNKIINPDLIVMDARKCFVNEGPAEGEVKEPNLILASDDRIAIDVEGVKIIQSFPRNSLKNFNPWQLTQIKMAAEFGLGAKSEKDYQTIYG